ncbi:MAG: type II toxin-antitoxin system RelE/ParE family toxin [Alkalinema sp. CAN_BIN05]|nr:type II toxin-antitoxin system RelE/ParE family toxin [Alkalinema sp. CAN_BIN05]
MSYEIIIKPAVLRYLRKSDKDLQQLIVDSIDLLSHNPCPDGCKKLKGETDLYRIRIGGIYRAIYEIRDKQLVVTVIKVGHRKDICR